MQTLSLRWRAWMARQTRPRLRVGEPPLRAELFSVEQLARHARGLAASHQVVTRHGSNRLLARLGNNEEILRAFNRATLAVNPGRRITPAAEWLLDNFYLIEEQIQMARRHLPRGYSRELPRLLNGPSAGLPRVYDIVLELISHVDAQIDAEPLSAFIAAYQTVHSLKLGELWAIPIMLRLGLIENLQRVTTRLTIAREDRDLADLWVDRLQDMAEKNPSHLVIVVADMAKSDLPLSSSFVAEFCQRLSRQSPVLHLARSWLEQRLVEQGLSIEQLVQSGKPKPGGRPGFRQPQHYQPAFPERDGLEGVRGEPESGRGDFALRPGRRLPARWILRPAIVTAMRSSSLARHSQLSEAEVAQRAIQLAADSARQKGRADRTAHVGFYLIDKGQSQLGQLAKVRWPWRTIIERSIHRFPLTFYAGGIGVLTLLATFGFVQAGPGAGSAGMETHFLHAGFPPLRQPTGRGADELAVHAAGKAPPAPAPGLFRAASRRIAARWWSCPRCSRAWTALIA